MNDLDMLNYAIENGIIDMGTIQQKIIMNERRKYIENHTNKVWQGKNGKWYTYLYDDITERKMIKRNTKEALEDAIVEFYKEKETAPYIKEVFYAWAKRKLEYGEILQQTYDRYETDFVRFFADSELYRVKFKYITENMLEDFIKITIRNKGLTAKAWGNLRTIINGIFKYAKKQGYTNISISQFMGDLEISPKTFTKRYFTDEESVFTDSEIDKIVKHISISETSIISLGIILAFQTGLRAGELSALKYSDLEDNILNVQRTEIRYKDKETRKYVFEVREHTKGRDGYRRIILTDEAIRTIKQIHLMNPFGEYLFTKNGVRIKEKAFTMKLYRICEKVGIPKRSLHKARKTYGTKLLNAGVNEKLIEKQMGHTDIQTTKNYYYFNNKDIEEAKKVITSAII